jgi:hypothetical protein
MSSDQVAAFTHQNNNLPTDGQGRLGESGLGLEVGDGGSHITRVDFHAFRKFSSLRRICEYGTVSPTDTAQYRVLISSVRLHRQASSRL